MTCLTLISYAQPTNIYQPNGSTTNFGKVTSDSLNYYVVNFPALTLMKIDGSNNATLVTTLTVDPFQTMIWNKGKGIYPVANGSPFKLFDGSTATDVTGGQLPMAGFTGDKVIQSDYFHKGNFTYFRTSDKIYKTDYTSAASIQTLATRQNLGFGGGINEMQHTTNSIIYWEVTTSTVSPPQLKRIDLITNNITKLDSSTTGTYDYGTVYNNEYYYCTPFGPSSVGVSKVIKVSDNGTKTVLYTETAPNKNLLRIIGVTPNGVIAIIATTSTGKEYVSISGSVATPLNFNTVANSRPSGDIGVGTSRTTSSLVYFVTLDTLYTVNSSNKALWVTDGTLAGTKKVFGGTPTTFAADGLTPQFPGSAEHCGNDLYFNGTKGTNVNRLIYVNGSTNNVTIYPINAGITTQPSFRKTASGIEFVALPLPTSSSEKAVHKVNCSTATGIEDNLANQILFDLFPNPSHGQITIKLAENLGSYKLTVLNLLGEIVYNEKLKEQINQH
ncbi:MAG: hypothetical protein IPI93_03635 [Sphingobacteriaceae bacterium]|nr:hypothetical protein [Sphingobacteriaceae bacterium]